MIYIYDSGVEYYFGEQSRVELNNDYDCKAFIYAVGDVVERKMITIAGINENIVSYLMFTSDCNDIVYEWDENEEALKEFGTLFDFLKYYRKITTSQITGEKNNSFSRLTTGRLL